MEKRNANNQQLQFLLITIVIFTLTAAAFLFLYKYDNKYTAKGPLAKEGVLALDSSTLTEFPVLFLIDDWEYYGGKLLSPEDFTNSSLIPDEYIFIGQFGGFEKYNAGSPHGSASYRLNIKVPTQTADYLLELPEIFSAYRLYINGRQVFQMGDPDPEHYHPETGNRSITIQAGGNIEILFAVSDYSHIYSGIVYPPAFGNPEAVTALLNGRLIFRSLLCAAALTIGALAVMVGLLIRRNTLTLLFGLLCLFFVGYTGYPLTRTLFTGLGIQYLVEQLSFCAMLCVTILIAVQINGPVKKWSIPFIAFGIFMCLSSVAVHLLLPQGLLSIMLLYSQLVSAYEWITAGFLVLSVWYAIQRQKTSLNPLFCGVTVFIGALVIDRILPMHEPILTGWFIEFASFALILCIGIITGHEIAARYRESSILTERANSMERLYESQLSHFHILEKEIKQIKTLKHDIRHHFMILDGFVKSQQYDKLSEYIKEFRFSAADHALPEYCPINVINILTHHYHTIAQQHQIQLDIRCDLSAAVNPGYTNITDADLCCLYSNLIENAVEACLRFESSPKTIRIAIFRVAPDILNLHIKNTAMNIRRHEKSFLSSKQNGQSGYGLSSITAIAQKYNGKADFSWNSESQEFESKITITA